MITRRSLIATGLLAPLAARAAGYPTRNVTLISPFAPGASVDSIARILGEGLATRLGKPFIVENKAGVGGTTGLISLARSAPDGYTLAIGATGALVINPHVASSASGFNPIKELTPIAKLADIPIVLVANPKANLRSVADLVQASNSKPEGLSYGTTGVNSAQHLAMELLKRATKANFVHVPYRGSAPVVTDVLGGQIPLASVDLTSADPHLRAGSLVAIAVTSRERVSFAPDIPTIAEAAVPGVELSGWAGMFSPAGLPADIVNQLTAAVSATLGDSATQERFRQLGCVPNYSSPADFARFLDVTSGQMAELLRSIGSN
jgi:tripartite-type tricarboxylate transporter receptor subunit TctC